jgi:hypothetical protein
MTEGVICVPLARLSRMLANLPLTPRPSGKQAVTRNTFEAGLARCSHPFAPGQCGCTRVAFDPFRFFSFENVHFNQK